jgi:N-acetylglucosamine-6-phosphate deacetylase
MKAEVFDALGPEGFGSYFLEWSEENQPIFTRVSRPPKGILAPGFVDIHIHGAFGIDVMTASKAEIKTLCRLLAAKGYEAWLPTTVTASCEAIKACLGELPDDPTIAGFHLEGPFISPYFAGAQPKPYIVHAPMVASAWDEVLNDSRLRIVTLAPEIPGALELTSRLIDQDVIVSMGHTNATFDEARIGFEFGAGHATHTFNAMRPFHHREAGTVGYVLDNPTLIAELIYDRHHVCRQAADLLVSVKGTDHIIGISDATAAAGLTKGTKMELWGSPVIVEHGQVTLEDGSLAGSAITLAEAFRNLADDFGAEAAIRLCCLNPRKALKMNHPPKVWLEFNFDLELVNIHGQGVVSTS